MKTLTYHEAQKIALQHLKRRIEALWPDLITDVTAPGTYQIDVQIDLVEAMVDVYSDVLKDTVRKIEYMEEKIEAARAADMEALEALSREDDDEAVQDPDGDEDVTVGKED